jgi:two-component system NtrC family sensor kinase
LKASSLYPIFYILLIGLVPIQVKAQHQPKADSIKEVLSDKPYLPDSTLFDLYQAVAFESTKPAEIIEYSQKAIALAKEKNMPVNLARTKLILGTGYLQMGDLVPAQEAFLEGALLYEEAGNAIGIASAYGYVAQVYRMQNHLKNAVLYYTKAIDIFWEAQDTVRLASTLQNLGYVYLRSSMPDSALKYFYQAKEIFDHKAHATATAYITGNIGLAYAQQGKYSSAEDNLRQAIQELERFEDNMAIAEFSTEIANIYQERGDIEMALSHAHRAYSLSKQDGFKEMIRDASQKLAELYGTAEDYKSAFHFQQQYIIYRDSLNNEETFRQIANLRTEYELAQKQTAIDYLQQEQQKQKILLAGLVIIIMLGGIIIFLLYKYNREKQEANQMLAKQKQELEQQRNQLQALNNTRNKLFSIISHDLRGPVNAFNGISRLINHYIQTNDLKQLTDVSHYIDTSASQLSSLLDNLLSWSVSQRGEFPYKPEQVQLKTLTDEIQGIFSTMAHAKNIKLETQVPESIALWADTNSLLTILRNLTSNALKFTNAGGTVKLSAVAKQAVAEISVTDTGIGITREKIESLQYITEEKRTWGTAGEKGLGISLQLVYEFTRMNGGTVEVNSKSGTGTTFIITIPLFDAVKKANPHHQQTAGK